MERARKLKVTAGIEPTADVGPVISKQVKLMLVEEIKQLTHISLS